MSSKASIGPVWLKNEMPPVADKPTMPLLALVPPFATGLIALAFGTGASLGYSLMNPDTVGSATVRL